MNEQTLELLDYIEERCFKFPNTTRQVHKYGFVELEDFSGDEAKIVNKARISTSHKRITMEKFGDKDKALLQHLMNNNHGTPFETVTFTWRLVIPIFVARQWVKHRISTWNEYSLRYREPLQMFYTPDVESVTLEKTLEQYEYWTEDHRTSYIKTLATLFDLVEEMYIKTCTEINSLRDKELLPPKKVGRDPLKARARELTRSMLPVCTYTDVYWDVNFRSLMNFFNLRLASDAQKEIRDYAEALYEIFKIQMPILAEVYENRRIKK